MLGVVMLIGATDTGKTTLSRLILQDALDAGITAAFIDGDIGVPVVGPPACVGLRTVKSEDDLADLSRADELRFVGSTSPQGVILPYVVSVAALVDIAHSEAELVVLDTTGEVSGVVGQTIVYHLMELCKPTLVIAMHRGQEMDPITGMLRRFLSARVAMANPPPGMVVPTPTQRRQARVDTFAAALAPPLQRWRVQTSVFAPTLAGSVRPLTSRRDAGGRPGRQGSLPWAGSPRIRRWCCPRGHSPRGGHPRASPRFHALGSRHLRYQQGSAASAHLRRLRRIHASRQSTRILKARARLDRGDGAEIGRGTSRPSPPASP